MKQKNPVIELLGDLEGISTISCDLFDTLILRKLGPPESVFVVLASEASRLKLLPDYLTPENFISLREQAQELTYQQFGHFREPSLEDIYRHFDGVIADTTSLRELELQLECESLIPNRYLLDALSHFADAGLHILLVSDTYFRKAEIERFLDHCQVPASVRRNLYVSADLQMSKRAGTIFKLLIDNHAHGQPGQILHMGDNYRSDFVNPAEAGLRSFHWRYAHREQTADDGQLASGSSVFFNSVSSLAAALSPYKENTLQDTGFRLGAGTYGPVLHGFLDWVVDGVARAEQCDAIVPLMRESFMLEPMLKALIEEKGVHHEVIPLAVSRIATKRIDLQAEASDDFAGLLLNFANASVAELLELLGLQSHVARVDLQTDARLYSLSSMAHDAHGVQLRALQSFLKRADIVKVSGDFFEDKITMLRQYMHDTLGSRGRFLTVDVGFQGQIQRNLDAHVDGTPLSFGHALMVGKSAVASSRLNGGRFFAYISSTKESAAITDRLHRAAPVLEQVLMGPCGSVRGYQRTEGRVVPVVDAFERHEEFDTCKKPIQQGIFAYLDACSGQREDLKRVGAIPDPAESARWSQALLDQLIAQPELAVARLFSCLKDEQNNGTAMALPICVSHDPSEPLPSPEERARLIAHSVWIAGSRALLGQEDAASAGITTLQLTGGCKLLIWGAGETLSALVKSELLSKVDIVGLIDSSPLVQGSLRHGYLVHPPSYVAENPDIAVLIASKKFCHEIDAQIEKLCSQAGVSKPVVLTLNESRR